MNNLTTRKIVLGLLMTLVLAFSCAGHRRRDHQVLLDLVGLTFKTLNAENQPIHGII